MLEHDAFVDVVSLADGAASHDVLERARDADGLLFATGVYWDSWGSPLQRFFEDASASEGTEVWLGKPAALIVTMHSVGGKAVLSRLMGVLNTFGMWVPPMAAMVYSFVNELAVASRPDDALTGDLWSGGDLPVVCHNLLTAVAGDRAWRSWAVDRQDPRRRWL
jgi:chromate reductase